MADDATLPTEEEIARLPRWARVAFAARCARRVLPLFTHDWPDVRADYVRNVAGAVQAGERYAEVPAEVDPADPGSDAFGLGLVATIVGQIAVKAAEAGHDSASYVAAVANVVAGVVIAETHPGIGFHAAEHADKAAAEAGFRCTAAIRHDYETLARLAATQHWTDDTPVPPEVFGPLWPDGPPPGWPADQPPSPPEPAAVPDDVRGLIVELFADPDTPPDVLREGLVRVYAALNQYHMARGGGVLTVEKFKHLIAEFAPV